MAKGNPRVRCVRRYGPASPMSGEEFNLLLRGYGLSKYGAARELGIHPRTVQHYCANSSPVPCWVLERLAFIARQRGAQ